MRGYGRDYEHRGWLDRAGETVRGWFGGGHDYDRDYGGPGNLRDWQHGTGWSGGTMDRHNLGGGMMNRGGMDRGGMDRGGMDRGTTREWFGNEYGGGGYNAGNDWGDYNKGGWGGDLFRRSNAGGVEPGRHFRGYGHGSTGGNGYEPF